MSNMYLLYAPLISAVLIGCGLALSQYIVLKAGIFSVATVGLAATGAYGAVILSEEHGVPYWLALAAMTVTGALVGLALAVPLARLRGIYQAIATLAFVHIVIAIILYADGHTGGALGISSIPRYVGVEAILACLVATIVVIWLAIASRLGRSLDAIRENEFVATSLGISVQKYQSVAFALSGAIAALFGGLQAFSTFAITPEFYGFDLIVAILTYVVLGGRTHLAGPLVGATLLILLPEISRPFGEYRMLISGALLIVVVIMLPDGVVGTMVAAFRKRRPEGTAPLEVKHEIKKGAA